jgi:SSS family transporter
MRRVQALDWTILAAYVAGVFALGARFARRQGAQGEYYLAGRSMTWLPVGLSIMATAFSALNFVAFPSEVLANGLYVLLAVPAFAVVAWPILRGIMPFYHGMGLCSAYEYFERRFDVSVRCLASALFVLWRLAWMALTLFIAGRLLGGITGLALWQAVGLATAIALVYTGAGGMRAVMWTDVLQGGVILTGLLATLAVVSLTGEGGLWGVLEGARSSGLTRPFAPFDPAMFSPDPRIRITLPSALIGASVAFLARYGVDQVVVQRYFAARSLADARRGFVLNLVMAVFAIGCLAGVGLAAIHTVGAVEVGGTLRPFAVFRQFVIGLPAPLTGLLVAGLLAAAMSSLDSGIHSCSAAIMTDFVDRFGLAPRGRGERLAWQIALTVALGVLAGAASLAVPLLGTVFGVANRIVNALGSPLLALLVAGMFTSISARGALAGTAIGIMLSVASSLWVSPLSLHHYATVNLLGTLAALAACEGAARLLGARTTSGQLAWTWRARMGT